MSLQLLRDVWYKWRQRHTLFLGACSGAALASLIVLAIMLAERLAFTQLFIVGGLQVAVIACVYGAHKAITRRMHVLEELSESDPATGCLNRRGFARALAEAQAARVEVALLAIDLDHFKQINDRYGHNVGDAVLGSVAAAIADAAGSRGIVARMGGEEFGVLLANTDAEMAGVMAEHMLARVRMSQLGAIAPGARVTMSVGIAAERVQTDKDAAALRARADEALYMAKRGGRDRVLLWAPGVRSNATPAAAATPIIRPARFSPGPMLF